MRKNNDWMFWLGLVMVLAGIGLGVYVGVWVCFVGGIVDVIEQVRAEDMSAVAVAWGIAKVLFAGFFGWLPSLLLIIPGYGFISATK